MATRRSRSPGLRVPLLLALALQSGVASAIQVTPNSPCSSVCIDSSSLDVSDPNSSNTQNSDLSCKDSDFTSSATGQKWTACLGCLQNSTFSQGSESDQGWFFYNLRYNFDYCIFGYPNATDVGTSPCQTSTACGQLSSALEDGIPSVGNNHSEFAYCSADNSAMTSSAYSQCLSCVAALDATVAVSNALVALEAGCIQKPSGDLVVGLSDSVFATAVISITEASSTSTGAATTSGGSRLAKTTVAAIAIVAVLAAAAACAAVFVLCRKRRAQRRRSTGFGNGSQGIKIDALGLGGGDIGSPIPGRTFSGYAGGGMAGGGLDGMSYLQSMNMAAALMQDEGTSEKRTSRLPELPQLTTLLPRAALRRPSATPGPAADESGLQRQSPLSPPSAFTHTSKSHGGHGGSRASPTFYDSPVFSTPTSATALLPAAAAFPASSMSPTAQLRQQQAQSMFAPYLPAVYRPSPVEGEHRTSSPGGFDGLGIMGGNVAGSSLSPQPPPQSSQLERLDLDLVQQTDEPGRRGAKKRGSRGRSGGDVSPGTGSPESTAAIKVSFPGPPARR